MNHQVLTSMAALSLLAAYACGGELDETTYGDQASVSQPLSGGAQGFAWVNGTGPVSSAYSHNSTGGAITVSSSALGSFRVSFAGLAGSGGNVQAVAYGSSNVRCKVNNFFSSSAGSLEINVRCHTPAGAPASSAFVVQYGRRTSNNGVGAYLWADQPTNGSYNPSSLYSWSSAGGANRIIRRGIGHYDVFLAGLASAGGSVQITAYGSDNDHCKVQSWGSSGSDQRVTVRCFDTAGAASDARFLLNYFGRHQVGTHDYGAHAWASNATSPLYTPNASYSYNSGEINGWEGCPGWIGENTAGRYSTGRYFMRHTMLDPTNSSVHVTAYGSDASYCKVEGWNGSGDGVEVRSRCFDASGAPDDTLYVETYSSSHFRGPC